jgi:hypothetical protein
VIENLVFGTFAGLLIWWQWDMNEGWVALYAKTALWTSLCASSTVLGIFETVQNYYLTKSLKTG